MNSGEAADLPGAVIEYDTDDDGSEVDDEAMEEAKTEDDRDAGEEDAEHRYAQEGVEIKSRWADGVTAEAVHFAILKAIYPEYNE